MLNPARPARRRRVWWVVGTVAVAWLGLGVYAAERWAHGDRDRAERLFRLCREGPLADAEFDEAMRYAADPDAVPWQYGWLAASGSAGASDDRRERVAALALRLLDDPRPFVRSMVVSAAAVYVRDPAGRQRVEAEAVKLLAGDFHQRAMAAQALGALGATDHLPRLRELAAAATDPIEQRLTATAVERLEAAAFVGPPAPGAADAPR